MFKEKLVGQIKQHPFAFVLFVLYMAFWIAVYSTLFWGNNKSADEVELFGYLAIGGLFLSIPYSLLILALSLIIKKSSSFYLWLTYLIYIPIIMNILMVLPFL